ncbi:MAG: Sec-independent protein translocase protein TatB [Acetobacteraceae bacterium]
MFDFSWAEIALVVVVALVAVGPKDLPAGLKTLAQVIKKARGMAGEFQGHMDDLLREADLGDIREQINDIRHFDLKGAVERAVDPDHSIHKTLSESPFAADSTGAAARSEPDGEVGVLDRPEIEAEAEASEDPEMLPEPCDAGLDVPAFVPPAIALAVMRPPAFVPPELLSMRS